MLLLCGIIFGNARHSYLIKHNRRYELPNSHYVFESKTYSKNYYEISFSSMTKDSHKDELLLRKDAIARFAVSQLEPFIIYVDTQFEFIPYVDTSIIHFANDFFNQSDINKVSYFLFDSNTTNLFLTDNKGHILREISNTSGVARVLDYLHRKQKMLIFLFIGLIILFFAFSYYADKHTVLTSYLNEEQIPIPRELQPSGLKLIKVEGIFIKDVCHIIEEYNNESVTKIREPRITNSGKYVIIKLPESTDFSTFAQLINYIKYSNKRTKYNVIGWYKMGDNLSDSTSIILSNKQLMLYIPDEDIEYDNVFIVTENGIHLKFDFKDPLHLTIERKERHRYVTPVGLK